jgi:hypothetical protein
MAIEDYYIDLFYVDLTKQPDGTGGFEYAYKIGESFKGSAVLGSASEQEVAGIRGEVGLQYNITTYKKNVLQKDDIIMFYNQEKEQIFVKISIPAQDTPKQSNQYYWKGLKGTAFKPDYRVVQ